VDSTEARDSYVRISYAWTMGYRKIPTVAAWRLAARFSRNSRLLGPAAIVWALSMVPVLAYALVQEFLNHSRPDPELLVWLTLFAFFQVLMIWAAYRTWAFVATHGSKIDQLLKPDQNRNVSRWLMARYRWYSQGLSVAFSILLFTLYLRWRTDDLESLVRIDWISYLSLAITATIGANVCYWLWVAPGIVHVMVGSGPLRLRWFDPASTPGLRVLAEGLGLAAVFLAYGSGAVAITSLLLPAALSTPTVQYALVTFSGFILLLSLRVGFLPFWWIFRAISRSKVETLSHLAEGIPELKVISDPVHARGQSLMDTYRAVSGAPNLPFSTGAVVQYLGALLGSFVGFLLTIMIS
jgi:hypothetical protein